MIRQLEADRSMRSAKWWRRWSMGAPGWRCDCSTLPGASGADTTCRKGRPSRRCGTYSVLPELSDGSSRGQGAL